MVADFDPEHPGLECFAAEDRKGGSMDKYLLTSDGKKLNTTNAEVPGCRNWIWWDADLLRETFRGIITVGEPVLLRTAENKVSGNGKERR